MSYARVLLLEDDPIWTETLTHLCEAEGATVYSASTRYDAQTLLQDRYINIAFVDISLHLGDAQNNEGMAFLEWIRAEGLHEVVQPIVVSGYPDFDRVRSAFHDHNVVDFLEKKSFQAFKAKTAMEEGLTRIGLCGALEIEIAGNLSLTDLLARHHWATREDIQELAVEFRDTLRRLFPEAEHLFVRSLPPGQSGAGILEVEPTYEDGVGAACVVKFGKRDKIRQESNDVRDYVENYTGAHSSTQVAAVCQRLLAAIRYQLVGTSLDKVTDFGDYYQQHTAPEITEGALNNLLRVTCGLWYDNRLPQRRKLDLVAHYTQVLSIEWDKVREGVSAVTSARRKDGEISFQGVAGRHVDPLAWLERNPQLHINAWQCITHGDLNQYNIFVAEDGQCWLIDFYRTGHGHILRDIVALEATIKISLTALPDLESHARLEQALLESPALNEVPVPDQADPLHKPLAVIAYLRRFAAPLTGREQNVREYNTALLMQMLRLLGLNLPRPHIHEKALLSAAMLCTWLGVEGESFQTGGAVQDKKPTERPTIRLAKRVFSLCGFQVVDTLFERQIKLVELGEEQGESSTELPIYVRCYESGESVSPAGLSELASSYTATERNERHHSYVIFHDQLQLDAITEIWSQERSGHSIVLCHATELEAMALKPERAQWTLNGLQDRWRIALSDPFESANSLSDPQWFFGQSRRSEVEELLRDVASGVKYIAVSGMRRIGKSVLLSRIAEACIERGYPTANLLCESITADGSTDVFYELLFRSLKALAESATQIYPTIKTGSLSVDHRSVYDRKSASNFPNDLDKLISEVTDAIQQRPRFVLIFDEFDRLYPTHGGRNDYIRFGQFLKAAIEGSSAGLRVTIITSMEYPYVNSINLFDERPGEQNPLYGRFKVRPVGNLARTDWTDMLRTLGALCGLSFSMESLERLYEFTDGHPEITRKLCSCLFSLMKSRRPQRSVSGDDVYQAVDLFITDTERYGYYLEKSFWENPFSPNLKVEQAITIALARNGPATLDSILDQVAPLVGVQVSREEADDTLKRLSSLYFVRESESKYSLCVRLYQEWVLKHNNMEVAGAS